MINTLDQLMHHRGVGVIYLDSRPRVLRKNKYADHFLARDTVIGCADNKLIFKRSSDKCFFDSKISEIQGGGDYASLFIKRSVDSPPIKLSLHPIMDSLSENDCETPTFLLLLKDTQEKNDLDIQSLADHYQLTTAEAKLIESLHSGLSLKEHSENRGIKTSTARWTLDNVFTKTYVNSQVELREVAARYNV